MTENVFPSAESSEPTVSQIMRTDVPTVSPDDSIPFIAKTLVDNQITGVPVIENERIIGIITESDIISREASVDVPTPVPFLDAIFMADAGPDFEDEMRRVLAVNARQLMSSPVYNIKSTATLAQVATLMIDRRINTVPVVDEQMKLVGIVSRADIVRVISRLENENE
ncbi:MAG: CBS domain-containing protein [Thermomicrobiales bacterium]